ncbi:MAG: hypothetical protein FJ145_23115 [Deltaproteobacteria bacterium]|nr:hypothetical protein [Deltaproteobacteria bacterium]
MLKLTFALSFLLLAVGQNPALGQEKIRIGVSAVSLGFLPTVAAEPRGFFTKYGLASEHVLVPCAVANNAIISEDLDYNVCM